jgi:peptidyl-prolyl cis-trans isomerase-like 4
LFLISKLYGDQAAFFEPETLPPMKHTKIGTLSMANNGSNMHGSQFFITLGENLEYLDEVHTVFGEVSEGLDVLQKLNGTIVDDTNRPYQDIRLERGPLLLFLAVSFCISTFCFSQNKSHCYY